MALRGGKLLASTGANNLEPNLRKNLLTVVGYGWVQHVNHRVIQLFTQGLIGRVEEDPIQTPVPPNSHQRRRPASICSPASSRLDNLT
jgi:hypothetical protein